MTYPSRKVQLLFDQYVTNTVANEGEPAALGKTTTGPVYYNDGTTEHKNRVWIRKGANLEVVLLARADDVGLPDVPGLPVRVAERFGIFWVTSYDRNDPAAAPVSGGTIPVLLGARAFEVYVGFTYQIFSGLIGPAWQAANNSTNKRIISVVPWHQDSAQVKVDVYYHMQNNFTGVNRLRITIGFISDGEDATGFDVYTNNQTSLTADIAPPANNATLDVWSNTLTLTSAITAGDLMGIEFWRYGNTSGTTNTGALNVSAVRVTHVS